MTSITNVPRRIDILLIDPSRANPHAPGWVHDFLTVIANAALVRWPHQFPGQQNGSLSPKLLRRISRVAQAYDRPVLIGKNLGADIAYTLLVSGQARAAVLISPLSLPQRSAYEHGPLLILDAPSLAVAAVSALRDTGICDIDSNTTPSSTNTLELAHHIGDWLNFHQLTTD
jgi:hypothetical protein